MLHEHVVHRRLERVGVDPLRHRQVALRVEVDAQHAVALLGEGDREVQRRRRLGDATLLVGEDDDLGLGLGSLRLTLCVFARRGRIPPRTASHPDRTRDDDGRRPGGDDGRRTTLRCAVGYSEDTLRRSTMPVPATVRPRSPSHQALTPVNGAPPRTPREPGTRWRPAWSPPRSPPRSRPGRHPHPAWPPRPRPGRSRSRPWCPPASAWSPPASSGSGSGPQVPAA